MPTTGKCWGQASPLLVPHYGLPCAAHCGLFRVWPHHSALPIIGESARFSKPAGASTGGQRSCTLRWKCLPALTASPAKRTDYSSPSLVFDGVGIGRQRLRTRSGRCVRREQRASQVLSEEPTSASRLHCAPICRLPVQPGLDHSGVPLTALLYPAPSSRLFESRIWALLKICGKCTIDSQVIASQIGEAVLVT
jgi:hypothetical protein